MEDEQVMLFEEHYLVIQGWMVRELHLKGNELIVYACIHGFSQTDNQYFTGHLKYLMEWTNSTKQNIINVLKSLQEKGLIEKYEFTKNNRKFYSYRSTKFTQVGKESLPSEVKKVYLPPLFSSNIYNHNNITMGNIIKPSLYNRQNNIKEIRKKINKKEKENNTQKTITLEAIKEYAKSRGRPDLAEKFYNYYTADKDRLWLDSNGKPVKNWKQKFIMWTTHDNLAFQLAKCGAGIEGKQDDTVYHGRQYSKEELNSLIVDIDKIEI